MAEPLAYVNGCFVPLAEASLPLRDGGFSGVAVTDNCRTWHGKLFRWADHLARFRRDCQDCFVPVPANDEAISAIAEKLIVDAIDVHVVTFATPTAFGLFTRPVDVQRNRRFETEGVWLQVVGHQPVEAAAVLPPRIKHRSRLVWHIAEQLADQHAIAILQDRPGGTLTETAIGNVLAVIDGVLVSPPRDLLLDGISLRVTLELAEAAGIKWKERLLTIEDAKAAREMMLTGTGFGLAAVSRLNDRKMVWPGPLTLALLAEWKFAVTERRA